MLKILCNFVSCLRDKPPQPAKQTDMQKFRVYNIKWKGKNAESLPKEIIVTIRDDKKNQDLDSLCKHISKEITIMSGGFSHQGCFFEPMK